MAKDYQFIDIQARGPGVVVAAFDNQVAYCTAAGATVTARVVAALRDLLERGVGEDGGEDGGEYGGGAVLARIRDWPGAPLADALPLRIAGGIHSLLLSGAQPQLKAVYSDQPGDRRRGHRGSSAARA